MNTSTRPAASGRRERPAFGSPPMLDARTYRELARAYFKLANMARGLAITTERNAELE